MTAPVSGSAGLPAAPVSGSAGLPAAPVSGSAGLTAPVIAGERIEFGDVTTGRLSAVVAGQGPPLLLVHSVNAAASVAEMRPLHQHGLATHTVFSIDLPGFGESQRGDRPYTPRLMTDALHAALALIRTRCGALPVQAVALSLGCEFLARAAAEAPDAFCSLALVSPTGFNGRKTWRGAPGSTRAVPGLLGVLRGPGWGGALFRGLTRPGVVRYFLQRTWGSKAIDETLWRDAVQTAMAPGAEFAPLTFLSAGLFSADITSMYERLAMPIWVAHGVRGDFTDYRGLGLLLQQRPNWRTTVYPTGALPYFEVPGRFCADFDDFLAAG